MAKHYHVISGLSGGYLPNSNEIYTSKRAALAGARWHIEQIRDMGEKVRGSAKYGYWESRESESLPGVYWDYVEVTGPCQDDCESWED